MCLVVIEKKDGMITLQKKNNDNNGEIPHPDYIYDMPAGLQISSILRHHELWKTIIYRMI